MNGYRYTPRPVWGQQFATTMVGRLILINVVVFVLQKLFPIVTGLFALTPRLVVQDFFVWQMVTYMFLHANFMHIFFNMLMLWIFGSTIEAVWGGSQFLRYYLICGVGGAVLSLFLSFNASVIGASGAIFGLYLAYAMMFPDNYIYLYFVFPVKAKYLVGGLAVLQLVNGIAGGEGIAYFAHLGGILAGLFFFRHQVMQRARFSLGARRRWKTYTNERSRPHEEQKQEQEQDNIDSILDKISSKGYERLTTTEKRILEHYSRKRREENGE